MIKMNNKQPRDERLQQISYKAGYYGFIVTYPLMVITFLLVLSDTWRDSAVTAIAILITFWAGLLTFVFYMWKHKVNRDVREMVWRNPEKMKKGLWRVTMLSPVIFAILLGIDYLFAAYINGEEWIFSERIWHQLFLFIVIMMSMYLSSWRKPKHLGVEDGN